MQPGEARQASSRKQEPMPEHQDLGDMKQDEFLRALALVGDWVARYRSGSVELPVLSRAMPGQVKHSLPESPPLHGEPVEDWLRDLEETILPGVTHWNHPGFMAYFGLTPSAAGILGDLVSSALNVNGMLWKTSPACTELEEVVLRWYANAMGLPADWFGMVTDTASTSTLVALAAAREATGLNVREEGLASKPQMVLYCSEEAHSSVDKAALVLGIGMCGIRRIPSDEQFHMRVDLLEEAVRKDFSAGRRPFAVVATVGTTSATAVDPVSAIADLCARHHLWLHVDAAYAGTAAIAKEFRWALSGCERADSVVANPHKWLFTPIDFSALFCRRPDTLRSAFSLIPEYLRTDAKGVTDLMDYTFQLGRRFRALKLWFVFRYFGTEGIAARIREHVRLAAEFAGWVDRHPRLERLAPVPFSVICFRVRPDGIADENELERTNSAVLEKVNASGAVFISHTKLHGRYCLRLAVGNLGTTTEHLRRAYEIVCRSAGLKE